MAHHGPAAARTFTFIDLFCGIGGFHQAMTALGGEAVFASDIDAACRAVYEANYGLAPAGDITKVEATEIPDHDVLCAGFPCQPFSKGGARRGFADRTRGTLFHDIARILKAKQPRFIVLENVRNIAGHDEGRTWQVIIAALHELGYRVNPTPVVMSPHRLAPHAGGAPQMRERVVILGEHRDYSIARGEADTDLAWDLTVPSYPTPGWDPQQWDFRRWLREHPAVEQDLSPYALSADEERWLRAWGDFAARIGPSLSGGFPVWDYALARQASKRGLPEWKVRFHERNRDLYRAHAETIDSWRSAHKVRSFPASRAKFEWQAQDAARTSTEDIFDLLVQFRPSGVRVKKPTYVGALVALVQTPVAGWLHRRITPSEAGTLQGFPLHFMRDPVDQKAYKQFGNAVNVDVIRTAAEALFSRCRF